MENHAIRESIGLKIQQSENLSLNKLLAFVFNLKMDNLNK